MYKPVVDTREVAHLLERKLSREIGKDVNVSLKPLDNGMNVAIYRKGEKIGEIWIDKNGETFGFIMDDEGSKEINLQLKDLLYLMEKF